MPAGKTSARKPARRAPAPKTQDRMTLAEALRALEQAGSAQTRKTYLRHGAQEPLFGVSFATLATLVKRIGVDHELALALWDTGNFDARNLAFKIADPQRLTPAALDRWARETLARMCGGYVSMLAQEGPHGFATAQRWLASREERLRCAGWGLTGQLASRSPEVPEPWFVERLAAVERGIAAAPNAEREAMNEALIHIGGRSAALRKAALGVAKRIGKVEVDHGDTSCKTPEAGPYIEKMWTHAKAKGFASPAEQEQGRATPRTRC